MAALSDYTGLITSEHNKQPNFLAVLAAVLQPFVDTINVIESMPAAYDIDTSVGAQEDVDGQWVGISRNVPVPIAGVYFSLDDPMLGLDQGVLKQPFDPSEGIVMLDDATYRLLLYAKIAANSWDGGLQTAQEILSQIFVSSPGTLVFIEDNFDMTMDVGIAGVIPSTLFIELMTELPLRPAGVLSNLYVTSVDGAPIFGIGAETAYIAGLDVGALATQIS